MFLTIRFDKSRVLLPFFCLSFSFDKCDFCTQSIAHPMHEYKQIYIQNRDRLILFHCDVTCILKAIDKMKLKPNELMFVFVYWFFFTRALNKHNSTEN